MAGIILATRATTRDPRDNTRGLQRVGCGRPLERIGSRCTACVQERGGGRAGRCSLEIRAGLDGSGTIKPDDGSMVSCPDTRGRRAVTLRGKSGEAATPHRAPLRPSLGDRQHRDPRSARRACPSRSAAPASCRESRPSWSSCRSTSLPSPPSGPSAAATATCAGPAPRQLRRSSAAHSDTRAPNFVLQNSIDRQARAVLLFAILLAI